jgi:hypothetical protein
MGWLSDAWEDIKDAAEDFAEFTINPFGITEDALEEISEFFAPDIPDIDIAFPGPVPEAEQGAGKVRRRYAVDPRISEIDPFGLDDLLKTASDADLNLPA